MYYPMPAEMVNTAVQMVICLFTAVGFLVSFLLTARA